LSHWLLTLARRWESPVRLVTALIEEMRRRQLVLPALSLIELILVRLSVGRGRSLHTTDWESQSPAARELEDLLIPSGKLKSAP